MAEFDRGELRAAFEAGKIPISDDNIRRLDGLLRSLAQQYRVRKLAREQDLNGQLARLKETKNSLAGLRDTEALLYAFEVETPQIISRLLGAVDYGIDFLKNEKEQRKVRGDDPETTLFMGLRDVYVSLSGKTGISDDGPLHRFANACTKLIDVSISLVESECDAGGFRSPLSVAAPFVWRCLTRSPVAPVSTPTGSPEAVTRPRFPQNVACGFPAPTLFGSWFTALRAPAAPGRGGAV
jgi:hypothetical protein